MKKRTDSKGRKLKEGESQRKDGRYQFCYTDSEGKRKVLYSWKLTSQDKVPTGKKDGKCLRELELEIAKENSTTVDFTKRTISECIEKFLAIRMDYSINTRASYETCLRLHIKPAFIGNLLLIEVTKSDILKFYSYLSKEKKLSSSVINNNHTLLNWVFQTAIKDGIIKKNPCTGCLRGYQMKTSRRTALTVQEQHMLLEFLKNGSNYYSKYYDLIAVLLGTGLRVGEFMGLTWDEIDLEKSCINLRHQLIYDDRSDKRTYAISSLKNGTPRVIPLCSTLVKIFQRRLEHYVAEGPTINGVNGFIFLNNAKRLYQRRVLNGIFHKIVVKFNETHTDITLPHISAHVFRHTFCTRIIELNMDLKAVQEIMGHSNAKVTLDVYTHLNQEVLNSEVHRVKLIDLGE